MRWRTDCMDKMDHNAHSVYLLYYHLIMVVKYRRKVFDENISDRADMYLSIYLLNMVLLWMNGITMKIMCM